MVTDRAGRDLFDFFDEHLEGISENAACLLMHKVTNALAVCRKMNELTSVKWRWSSNILGIEIQIHPSSKKRLESYTDLERRE